ncbi:unnamed protein product [Tenebrio molitor]|nr:unnamed protein product [Tenebrio molitor]
MLLAFDIYKKNIQDILCKIKMVSLHFRVEYSSASPPDT